MKPKTVRTSIDVPQDLHRRLHEAAARRGCSARQLILASIDRPIVPSTGRTIDLTNEQIYDLIALP